MTPPLEGSDQVLSATLPYMYCRYFHFAVISFPNLILAFYVFSARCQDHLAASKRGAQVERRPLTGGSRINQWELLKRKRRKTVFVNFGLRKFFRKLYR